MPLQIKTDNIAYLQSAIDLLDSMTIRHLDADNFLHIVKNEPVLQEPFNHPSRNGNLSYTHTMVVSTNGQVIYWQVILPKTYPSFKKIHPNIYVFKLPPEAIAITGPNNISVNDISEYDTMSRLRKQLRIINNNSALKQELFLANINQTDWNMTDATSYPIDHLAQSPLLCEALHYDISNLASDTVGIPKMDRLLFTYLNTLQHLCEFNNILPQNN